MLFFEARRRILKPDGVDGFEWLPLDDVGLEVGSAIVIMFRICILYSLCRKFCCGLLFAYFF